MTNASFSWECDYRVNFMMALDHGGSSLQKTLRKESTLVTSLLCDSLLDTQSRGIAYSVIPSLPREQISETSHYIPVLLEWGLGVSHPYSRLILIQL